tara:strand:+ start:4485 stop:5114 length:630 start_codon:yes stop_codon:yes gene_type:complete
MLGLMSSNDRKHERHPTVLAIRFVSATEFVTEYAENLSVGGLFVRQAQNLEPLSEITVHIDLAGFDSFKVKARVAHVMDEAMAARMGRGPGAGLQLTEVPPGFEQALSGYLARLGRRRDFLVLADDAGCVKLLDEAGFRAEPTNPGVVTEQSLASTEVLAVVVGKTSSAMFRDVLAASPRPLPVIGCHYEVDEEPLLAELDRLVVLRSP